MRTRSGAAKIADEVSTAAERPRVSMPVGGLAEVVYQEGGPELTVTWGAETYRPMQFHSLEIGSYKMTVQVQPGETVRQAAERALTELEQVAEQDFRRKVGRYLERVRELDAVVRSEAK